MQFKAICICLAVLCVCAACAERTDNPVKLAQGIMAGEVTENSVILQARLTATDTLVNGGVPGMSGIGYFEIAFSPDFSDEFKTRILVAAKKSDYILKFKVAHLSPGTHYYYRLMYGRDETNLTPSHTGEFKTLQGAAGTEPVSFVVVTGMNYARHFYGRGDGIRKSWPGYSGPDRELGFPALKTITDMEPDFFVGTGDNIYYDRNIPGQKDAETLAEMRMRWQEQFVRPRFIDMFAAVPTYWEKDDHDHRYNDSDTLDNGKLPSHKLGVMTFLEQLPIAGPDDPEPLTYRTHRVSKHLQIWLTEGRDYRSPIAAPDGPEKTMWGIKQKEWLKRTLLASDATYKILISPTSLVGPDEWGKKCDNHINCYRHERKEFFDFLIENQMQDKNFYVICGDRHWQYHAQDPSGIEEFSCGALVDGNSRLGVEAGAPNSTDPEGKIRQFYLQPEPSGGFLHVSISETENAARAEFTHFDENGIVLYQAVK